MTMPDGRQMLIYTGVVRELDEQGVRRGLQRQCVAIGDGLNYEKIDANPILTVENLPEGANKYEFRDPKIWQEKDGTYRMVTCCANHERDARIVCSQVWTDRNGAAERSDPEQWALRQCLGMPGVLPARRQMGAPDFSDGHAPGGV